METDLYARSLTDECDALIRMHTESIKLLDHDSPVAEWHRNKIMMTLLDRLRPDILKKLHEDAENYPISTEIMIKELRENLSYLNLTVSTAQSMCQLDNNNLGIIELNKLFS